MTLLKSFLTAMEARQSSTSASSLPSASDLLILDTLIAAFQISLDKIFMSSSNVSSLSDQLAAAAVAASAADDKADTPKTAAARRRQRRDAAAASADWVGSLPRSVESAQQLVPSIARLVGLFVQAAKTTVLDQYRRVEEWVEEIAGYTPPPQAAAAAAVDCGQVAAVNSTLINSLCIVGSRCQVGDIDYRKRCLRFWV